MKAFVGGVVAMVVIAVVAWVVLGTFDMSAQDVFSSTRGSVRL
jgi:hypothetical protein